MMLLGELIINDYTEGRGENQFGEMSYKIFFIVSRAAL